VAEIVLLSLSLALDLPQGDLNIAELVFQALRLLLLIGLFGVVLGSKVLQTKQIEVDEENTPLLNQNDPGLNNFGGTQTATDGAAYGSCNAREHSGSSAKVKSSSGANAKNGPAKGGALWTCIKSFRVSLLLYAASPLSSTANVTLMSPILIQGADAVPVFLAFG